MDQCFHRCYGALYNNVCVSDSAVTCANYVLTLWFKMPPVACPQQWWQQGLDTKLPDWNGPSYSP